MNMLASFIKICCSEVSLKFISGFGSRKVCLARYPGPPGDRFIRNNVWWIHRTTVLVATFCVASSGCCNNNSNRSLGISPGRITQLALIVHGPEQISVPSGWAKLGNGFYVYICPVHYLSHDRPLKLAAFMWLSSIFNILFSKNSIFVFFDDFQIIFKLRPSSMTVLIKYNCSNTSWYPFELYVSISLKKCSNCKKFMQKFLPFHNQ